LLQRGDAECAAGYLRDALRMRRQIYGSSAAHAEVALTLGKLGEADRMRGDLRGAASHFAAQREMFEILALREIGISAPPPPQPPPPQPTALVSATAAASVAASAPVPPLQRILRSVTAAGGDGAPPPPPPKLLNQLLSAVRWQVASSPVMALCLLWPYAYTGSIFARSVLQRARRWRLAGGAARLAARKRSSPVG
jgi:hypothetical protein